MQQKSEVNLIMILCDAVFGENLVVSREECAERCFGRGFGGCDDVVEEFDILSILALGLWSTIRPRVMIRAVYLHH